MATTAMAIILAMPTMDTAMATSDMPDMPDMPILMPTEATMARGPLMPRLPPLLRPPLMLRLMPMLTMVSTDMALPTTVMDTVLPTTDTAMDTPELTDMPLMPIPMPTTVTTTARGLLMLRLPPLLRLMLMLTTDTTDMPVLMPTDMPMPTVDTT